MGPLAEILAATEAYVLTVAGVFTRIAAAAFLVPGLGERTIPLRLRLAAALAITLVLAPLMQPLLAETPGDVPGIARMIAAEAVSGLAIGLGFRMLIFALQIAGSAAAYHLSISHVFATPVAETPEPTIATFLAMGGTVLALNAGLHLQLVAALAALYEVLPFARFPAPGDLAALGTARVADVFALGIALAVPFIAISFAYNLALGAISRAMPQLLVVLIGVPLLIGLGLLTLHAALPAIFARWLGALAALFADPLGGIG